MAPSAPSRSVFQDAKFWSKFTIIVLCGMVLFTGSAVLTSAKSPNVIVFFTDDQGWADLGIQGLEDDIETPHIDRIAEEGVRFTNGYITAPQCTPSRAGLLSGQYQQRFGLDDNTYGPLRRDVMLLPARLQRLGYRTGLVGKWHLEINHLAVDWLKAHQPQLKPEPGVVAKIPFDQILDYYPHRRGFDETYAGYHDKYWATHDLDGNELDEPAYLPNDGYRLDLVSRAAVSFIDRNHDEPFFLYVPYYAPHVPMEATQHYLDRFPGDMPERRRYCLAMMAAIDDGVGDIVQSLAEHKIDEDTLIFFVSDNGAPLKIHKEDLPISYKLGAWDGSLNGPLAGEKGMLSEGGIRVPFVVHWKSKIPGGQVIDTPVSSLDIAATVMALTEAGVPGNADGVDLMPMMTGRGITPPNRKLFWKFWTQRAVRDGKWKYLEVGTEHEFLFDLESDPNERHSLLDQHPGLVKSLKTALNSWTGELMYPQRYDGEMNNQEAVWFEHYFDLSSH